MTELFDHPILSRLDSPASHAGHDINQGIARIESLKLRLLGNPAISPMEKQELFRELDILRAEYLNLTVVANRQPMTDRAVPAVPGDHRGPDDLELEGILGQNPVIQGNLKRIARIAPTRLTVLLEGETGSGKELFARIVHLNSTREKFVAVNCGAFPPNIIESELYGHVKGAFTGAVSHRKGKFEEANGGTIFLDEIGDLQFDAQVKLLRVLDQGEIQRVGADQPQRIDVRIIAATNRDLRAMVEDGTFREDLYYRLSICSIWIPPLRERRDEIEILFNYFLQQTANENGLPQPQIADKLRLFIYKRYDFPGNIRELKNLCQYIAHIYDGNPVVIEDLPQRYQDSQRHLAGTGRGDDESRLRTIRGSAEKDLLTEVLRNHRGDIQAVCAELGLSRSRVYQLLKKHELRTRDFYG